MGADRVGRDRAPVHRPPHPPRGLRSAARRGGLAARRLIAATAVALALCCLFPTGAAADTVTPQVYRQRLVQARDLLTRARTSSGAAQAAAISEAVALLRRTDGLALRGGVTVGVDDRAVADRVAASPGALSTAIEVTELLIATADRASDPQIDPATADRQLGEALRDLPAASGPSGLVDAISRAVLRFISGIEGPTIDFWLILPIIGLLGTAVIVFVLATLGRSLPERVRREVVLREPGAIDRPDPAVHLRAADEALAAGHARDAIHSLYLFVIASLAAREIVRYDPTLTNRELIVRAAAIPHADALREIIATYERSWFGLREPTRDEAERARGLATRVAG